MSTVRIEDTESGRRLHMEGEMTVYSAFYFRDTVLAALPPQGKLEIDLSGVREIDSAGLQVMLQLKSKCATGLSFTNYSPAVRRVLDVCKLTAYMNDEPTPASELGRRRPQPYRYGGGRGDD